MMFKSIYLDNAATTKVDDKVIEEMMPYLKKYYGNPSSIHSYGYDAKDAIDDARERIANLLNADFDEIIFTSSGTESNNTVFYSLLEQDKKEIITTRMEHKSIMKMLNFLQKKGFKIHYLKNNKKGFIDLKDLKSKINKNTALVSIILANNEIGTIQDIEKISEICKDVPLHMDACQAFTKTNINLKKLNIDFLSISGHKIHAPKGIAALYINRNSKIEPLLRGGPQEFGKRASTENVPGIVAFAKAAEINSKSKVSKYVFNLQKEFSKMLLEIENSFLNGADIGKNRLYNNINICFKGVENSSLGSLLDKKGVCASSGSACNSKEIEPSHVLKAIGLSNFDANCSIRFSLSRFNTMEEIEKAFSIIEKSVKKLRKKSFLF